MVKKLKILLLGEYSGFFTNLREGFLQSGHIVDFYHNGDGKKNIKATGEKLCSESNSFFIKTKENIRKIKGLKNYDLILMVSPNIFNPIFTIYFFKILKKNNGKLYMISCGGTYELYNAVKKKKFKYYMYDDDLTNTYKKPKKIYEQLLLGPLYILNEMYVFKHCDKIIPIAYEYYLPFAHYDNIGPIIPLPVNTKKVSPVFKLNGDKINIYFGLNQPFYKGANYILPALKKIEKEFYDLVNIEIKELIPFDEYTKIMNQADIVVDQCKSYCWGMNAILSMTKGKVVFSGAEEETLKLFKIKNSPIINIIPNSEMIYESIKKLIQNKDEIVRLKKESYEFVLKFHDAKKIANQYIELYENYNR